LVNWFAKHSLTECFSAIVFKIFARSQVTFEKLPKRKNSHYPSSEARVSARVGLALVVDQTLACRFA